MEKMLVKECFRFEFDDGYMQVSKGSVDDEIIFSWEIDDYNNEPIYLQMSSCNFSRFLDILSSLE